MIQTLWIMYLSVVSGLPAITAPTQAGALLMLMALTLTMMTTLLLSSWSAMILFIIFISGLLVLFSYFISIQPNHPMNPNTFLISLFVNVLFSTLLTLTPPLTPTQASYASVSWTLSLKSLSIITLLTLMLLMTMILVSSITKLVGSLRPFNPYYL